MKRTILIADDEALERKALRKILDAITGFEIHEAENGIEVLELVARCQPVLIILDIRMPGKDGIQVAEQLRQEFPGIAIIFLTAFDQFDYARNAVRLQVDDFLLKPASAQEVGAALERVLIRIQNREAELHFKHVAQAQLDSAIKLMADRIRHDLSVGLPELEQIQRFMELHGRAGGLRALLEFRGLHSSNQLRLVTLLAETFFTHEHCIALSNLWQQAGRVILLGSIVQTGQTELQTLVRTFREKVRTELGIGLVIGVAVTTGEMAAPELLVTSAHRAATIAGVGNPVLIVACGNDLSEAGKSTQPHSNQFLSPLVVRVLQILESRYADDLSLQEVSNMVGVSSFQVSRQLARCTGNGFSDCLAHFRIAAAKRYLTDGQLSVKEIAYLSGFNDPAYFARVFRRLENCSPAEFRAARQQGEVSRAIV